MSRESFNTAEQYLLEHWGEARQLEEAMESVREKYKSIWQRIASVVAERVPEFDWSVQYVTQFWTKGSAGFGRKGWPDAGRGWGPGVWIEYLRLETLADPALPSPYVYWWVAPFKKAGLDPLALKRRLRDAAASELTDEEKAVINIGATDDESALRYDLPDKQQLLQMLVKDDGQPLVDLVVSRVLALAKFLPVVDEFFAAAPTAKR